jgi:acyl-coenzyme A synthetase/AMP-(fatty) acid ligase
MPAMRDRVLSRLATSIINTYGTNEVGPICVMTQEGRGIVVPCTEVQIVNDVDQEVPMGESGQLRVRNQIMADAYVDNPSASLDRFKQGWFYPGDEAVMTSFNEIRLLGRADDMLNLAGYKQRPEEFEDVVKGVAGVADAAFLTRNASDGSVQLCLALVLDHPGQKDEVFREIKNVLKVPVSNILLMLVRTLPRTNTGKIRRKELLTLFQVPTVDR